MRHTHDTLNRARLHWSDIADAIAWAQRHGGRIARCNNTHEVYWYGCSVTQSEILAEAPVMGIAEFGTVDCFTARRAGR